MANEKPLPQSNRQKPPPRKPVAGERAGRSGEGARSVIPHLRADMRARAVAGIAKRSDREI